MYYIAMDGGGTKLVGLVFDDAYRLISSARVEGTHLSVYPIEAVRAHIIDCYTRILAGLPRPVEIECLYTVCGNADLYTELLPEGVTLRRAHKIGESVAALYAGSVCHDGFVALSGTGSDVFCIRNDQLVTIIGGWGAILGDEGSGVWMARHAMQAALRAQDGWGEPTIFGEIVMETYHLPTLDDYVPYLYDTPAPFRRLGELMPLVAEGANRGDPVMLRVLRDGGRILADQMIAMLRRNPDMEPHITACGGAWKAHPAIAEAFCERLTEVYPTASFSLPRFEHIMGGPICLAMERGEDLNAVTELMSRNFAAFLWNAQP